MIALVALVALGLSILHAFLTFSIVGDMLDVFHDIHSVQAVWRFGFISARPWLYLPYLPVTAALLVLLSPEGEFQRWYEHIPVTFAFAIHMLVVMLLTFVVVFVFPFTIANLGTTAFWILAAGLGMSWCAAAAAGLLD
ncbi:hypothetical protein ACN9JG_21165 (plasmid) [Cereibacter azotoformans]|uniref:Uncharacterized protein n=1 Tax=Cereibacter azotoformans TaxID=43057 RepID=A0A2T5JTA8_9RHOB|nr:hypothetical protein [Cereibacter azotoformans]PTR13376.1 hypothetical protein C8J28_1226 [Cereibacter azotoformans]